MKDLEEVQGQKKPVLTRPRRGKGKKAESSQKQSQKKCGRCGLNHTKPEMMMLLQEAVALTIGS